jgi:branched-chain amino acid transport system permease protein
MLTVQQIINGLGLVGPIMLIAVSLSTVLASLRVLNVAVGAIFVAAALTSIYASNRFGLAGLIIVAILVSTLLSVALEVFVLAPQRKRPGNPEIGSFAATLGVSFVITGIAATVTSAQDVVLPEHLARITGTIDIGGLRVDTLRVSVFLLSIVLAIAVLVFIRRSRTGKLYRALASDPYLAGTLGMRARRVALHSWLLCGVLLGIATVLIVLESRGVSSNSGDDYLLIPFAAVIAGGLGSLVGTVIASLFFGIATSVVTVLTAQPGYQQAVVFAVLLLMLFVRPQGLIRQPTAEREF